MAVSEEVDYRGGWMKVLYVSHSFPPYHFRGTEVYVMELGEAMSGRCEVMVFHLVDEAGASVRLERGDYRGIPTRRAHVRLDPSDPEKYFFHPGVENIFKEVLAEFAPDIVHFAYFAGGLPLTLSAFARASGAATAITVTDFSGLCPRAQLTDREGAACPGPRKGVRCVWCLFGRSFFDGHSRADRLVRERLPASLTRHFAKPERSLVERRLRAVSEAFQRSAVSFPNRDIQRTHREEGIGQDSLVMDYGIDTRPFSGHEKTGSDVPRIGFVGQLLPHKGLHVLAKAVSDLPGEWRLIIHGPANDEASRHYLESLSLPAGRAEFRGPFPFEDMNRVLADIDILVVPSTWRENCPLIVKYALVTGTPCLAADQPGMIGEPRERPGLYYFRPGDAADLRKRLIEFLEGGPPFHDGRAAGVTDMQDQAGRWLEIYRRLIEERP